MRKFNKGHAIITFIIAIYLGLLSSVFSGIFNTYSVITTLVSGDILGVWQTSSGGFKNITWGNTVTQMFSNPFDISLAEHYILVGDSSALATSARLKGEIQLVIPDLCGSVATRNTTSTSVLYNHCLFADDQDVTNNYAEWFVVVPKDMDIHSDPTGVFYFSLAAADTTGHHEYVASMCVVAVSAARDCTPGDPIDLVFGEDSAGASGDIEKTTGAGTLTGWGAKMTPGSMMRIRIARHGNDGTNDTSTVDSTDYAFVISYSSAPGN